MYLSRDDTMAVLYARMTGTRPTSEAAERASEWSLLRLAGAHLERLGVSTRALSPEEIFTRASGSDFPVLVESTLNRVARGAYDSYPGGLRKIARTVAAPDFRARGSVVLSEAAALQPVDEGAYFAESK